MRLRYLHLPRCGPLVDISIVFGQEEMLFGPDEPGKRKGAINFVVGVNGTGKSSLLRAIYQTFRALKLNEMPALPLTLAWDRTVGRERFTALLHYPSDSDNAPWFAVFKRVPDTATEYDWQAQVQGMGKEGPFGEPLHFVGDGEPITTSLLQAHLPTWLAAYTSGSEILWDNLELPSLHTDQLVDGEGSTADDRPPGWTVERELEEEVSSKLIDTLARFEPKVQEETKLSKGMAALLPVVSEPSVSEECEAVKKIRGKIITNSLLWSGKNPEPSFRIKTADLRIAAIALSLRQAALELKGNNADWQREALRKEFLSHQKKPDFGEGARRVFNQLDWFWPTHLSFTYNDCEDSVSERQHEQLLCLLALADEVTQQPRGRHRVTISLGPADSIELRSRLVEVLPLDMTSENLYMTANRIEGCPTGAEAVMRVFSDNKDLDATLMETFDTLRQWQASGFMEDVTLTIKRLSRTTSADGEPDDVVITFDLLSDGEQMLLGRTALLFLLQQQHGALLLLDEPETHFNDVWKREIIDLVDDAILKTTSAQVIVATHTSLALTDVFSSEIVRLVRRGECIEADSPAFPTFGSDPGRILLHVFGSPDVIGARAAEFLREKLKKEWTAEERAVLERLVNEIGSGWPRAKLTEILGKLDAPSGS